MGGIIKPIKNNTMSRLNLRRVGNTDLAYKEAMELTTKGKLVSQKTPMSKGVFAFHVPDLQVPVSLVSGLTMPEAAKAYYKAKYPNPTTDNNPTIRLGGTVCVKLEDDSIEAVHLNQLAVGDIGDEPWFEVEACSPEETDFVAAEGENNSSKADNVNPLTD